MRNKEPVATSFAVSGLKREHLELVRSNDFYVLNTQFKCLLEKKLIKTTSWSVFTITRTLFHYELVLVKFICCSNGNNCKRSFTFVSSLPTMLFFARSLPAFQRILHEHGDGHRPNSTGNRRDGLCFFFCRSKVHITTQ